MAEEIDCDTLQKYLSVLSNYKITGYVNFNKRAQKWIEENLDCTPTAFAEQMFRYVKKGGKVKRVREMGNPEDYSNEFHDDLVFTYGGQKLYVETVFDDDKDPDWCRIDVVNIKLHKR